MDREPAKLCKRKSLILRMVLETAWNLDKQGQPRTYIGTYSWGERVYECRNCWGKFETWEAALEHLKPSVYNQK